MSRVTKPINVVYDHFSCVKTNHLVGYSTLLCCHKNHTSETPCPPQLLDDLLFVYEATVSLGTSSMGRVKSWLDLSGRLLSLSKASPSGHQGYQISVFYFLNDLELFLVYL
uniref:Uncharacterized protein n=1 Tax=Bracon brevicornis TaxID=1563983 RepID=A0A6V7L2Z8_9HYME